MAARAGVHTTSRVATSRCQVAGSPVGAYPDSWPFGSGPRLPLGATSYDRQGGGRRCQKANGRGVQGILAPAWHPDSQERSSAPGFRSIGMVLLAALAAVSVLAQVPSAVQPALDHISTKSLRSNVSFLASDLLQGRATPSPGLEIAAEFIAAEFRRAGLEPAGDNSYFQTARMKQVEPNWNGFQFTMVHGEQTVTIKAEDAAVLTLAAVDLKNVPATLDTSHAMGKVVFLPAAKLKEFEGVTNLRHRLRAAGAVAAVVTGRRPRFTAPLFDPSDEDTAIPVFSIRGDAVAAMLKKFPDAKVSIHLAAPKGKQRSPEERGGHSPRLRSVMKDTWVMVTCHYDHMGVAERRRRRHIQRRQRRCQRHGERDGGSRRAGVA